MIKKENQEKGFTLTETMVVVVIFTVMMSLALIVFLGSVRVQRAALFQQRLVNETSYALRVVEKNIRSGAMGKADITKTEIEKLVNSSSVTIVDVKTEESNDRITVLLKSSIKVDEKNDIEFTLQATAKKR